jgi:hypothetical protein
MPAPSSWILTEDFAGLRAQALGLAEAAALAPEIRVLRPRGIWRRVPAAFWPAPLRAVDPPAVAPPLPEIVVGCGGKSAALIAALRGRMRGVVIQHPRMPIRRFDLIVAGRHDELTGPNVIVTRTAMHRVTPDRLVEARAVWRPRLAHLPRPLVAVLVGGSNGRFRLDGLVGHALAERLALMMRLDRTGLIVTPSRRTDPAVTHALAATLRPLGAEVWDGSGENPYFGMLAVADLIVVTADSVSMLSEAVATAAPVMSYALPGHSRRQQLFVQGLIDDRRVRAYQGRFDHWPVAPLDDTPAAAGEMRRRFGF